MNINSFPTDDSYNNAEESDETYIIKKFEDGYETQCTLPSSLYCHIVGAKGQTKSKLQQETGTKIIIPRQNEKGDIGKYDIYTNG